MPDNITLQAKAEGTTNDPRKSLFASLGNYSRLGLPPLATADASIWLRKRELLGRHPMDSPIMKSVIDCCNARFDEL